MDTIVTPSAEHLGLSALELDVHPQNETRRFPDDEVYVQLDEIASLDDVVVVHSGQPGPNRGLAYLYGTLDLLAENDCTVTLVFSYVPYSRQDGEFYEGTLNYVRAMLRKIARYYGVERMYAIDPHFGHREWIAETSLETVRAFPAIQDNVEMDDYMVVGPDLGAVERFGIPGYEKARKSAYDVGLTGDLDVDGKNVLVFDDLIATGGTLVEAYQRLHEQGARTVQAAAVHGVIDEGVRRTRETYDALYLTDTVRNGLANVSVRPLIEDIVDATNP